MNTKGLDLNMLGVFTTLYNEGSVSGAANRLNVSQPTVSFSLNKLRQAFNDDLFIRTGGRMQPTPLAETLLDPILRILETVDTELLQRVQFSPGVSRRTFDLNVSDIGEVTFLPSLLERLRREAPGIALTCHSLAYDRLGHAMEVGEIDLAVGHFPDLSGAAFYEQRLFAQGFVCIARRGHPSIHADMDTKTFLAAEHIRVINEGRSQEIYEAYLAENNLIRNVRLTASHFMSVPPIVANTDMIAVVPRSLALYWADLIPDLAVLAPPLEIPTYNLKQKWHRRTHTDPGLQWVRGIIAELFLNNDPTRS